MLHPRGTGTGTGFWETEEPWARALRVHELRDDLPDASAPARKRRWRRSRARSRGMPVTNCRNEFLGEEGKPPPADDGR